MSDRLGRINALRTMIGICVVAMPALYAAGSNVALLYAAVFVVLALRNATLRERRGGGGLLGYKEHGCQLRDSVYGVGHGRNHRASRRRGATGFTTTRRHFTPPLPLRAWRWCVNWAHGDRL
jgi:hypothetical protein